MTDTLSKAVTALRTLESTNPGLMAAALAAVERKASRLPNGSEITADASTLVALFLPAEYVTGEKHPSSTKEAERLAEYAAREAIRRTREQEARRAARAGISLDALTEADPAHADALADKSATRYGTGATGSATPAADALRQVRREHALPALVAAALPEHRPILAAALDAYRERVAGLTPRAAAQVTLAGALAHAQGHPSGSRQERATRAALAAALADVEPYLDAILAEPVERTTPERRTLPTSRRAVEVTFPAAPRLITTGPGEVPPALAAAHREHAEHAKRLARWTALERRLTHPGQPADPYPFGTPDEPAQALPTAAETRRREVTGRALTGTSSTPAMSPSATAERITQDRLERHAHALTLAAWTPSPKAPRRPWTQEARTLADALAALDTARRKAARLDRPRPLAHASRVVTFLPSLDRWTGSLFGPVEHASTVEVRTQDGTLVERQPVERWTPAHTALVLADLTDTSRPGPLALAEGVTAQEAHAGERAALFQAQPVRKPSSTRRGSRVGSTGPTTSDRPRPTPVPRVLEHAARVAALEPLPPRPCTCGSGLGARGIECPAHDEN